MNIRIHYRFLLLLAANFMILSHVEASNHSITAGVGYNGIHDIGSLESYWSSNNGLTFFVDAPVGIGNLEFEITTESFTTNVAQAPDYSAWTWAFGWNYPIKIIPRLTLLPGFTVGSYKMEFDDPSLHKTAKQEAEYFGALNTRLEYKLYRFTNIYVKYNYKKVYTFHPMEMTNIHAGIAFDMNVPTRLKSLFN